MTDLPPSRIKDISLASRIPEGELAWMERLYPVTHAAGREIAGRDFKGRTIIVSGHLLLDNICVTLPLLDAGARVLAIACNEDSTDDRAAAYLAAKGAHVLGWSGMTPAERQELVKLAASVDADVVSDMGAEVTVAMAARGHQPWGALEATTTGLHVLTEHKTVPFPVFDWNSIPLKDALHNRWHVAATCWPTFEQVTGINLFGRKVLVVGFGPVGRGVAQRAIALGATTLVAERDPVRMLEAQHFGCIPSTLEDGLAAARIVVTATGRAKVIDDSHFGWLRDGTILFNVGHGSREIDVDALDNLPRKNVRPWIDAHQLPGERSVYLLNRGSLLNLAPGSAAFGADLFDPFAAIILRGIEWLLDGGAKDFAPGLHGFPIQIEREIAQATIASRK
ncbi:adenosylhomocysteinase [Lacibacterium aquatile]|uniref:Adenosylhomocysteinase n=1 Tax=Lacibacterium aquatile TaxID=1168082 RepID=A0ABW5E095_9PROT